VITAFIIGSTPRTVDYFHRACLGVRGLSLPHVLDEPPALHQLLRMMSTHRPLIVFLELDPLGRSYQTAVDILVSHPGTKIIGFAGERADVSPAEVAEFGFSAVLEPPFDERKLLVAAQKALQTGARAAGRVTVFQGAAGGVGTTTTAVNVAASLAEDFGRKVLYLDCDLRSSPLSYWFDLVSGASIVEALESIQTDDRAWMGMVSEARGFDGLLAPRLMASGGTFTGWDFLRLLGHAAIRYDHVLVDLPVSPRSEFEVVFERATAKIVVANPETVSAALARRRLDEMQALGADGASLAAVLNRTGNSRMRTPEAEAILKVPVLAELPDHDGAQGELSLKAAFFGRRSKQLKAYRDLARMLGGEDSQERTERPNEERVNGAAGSVSGISLQDSSANLL